MVTKIGALIMTVLIVARIIVAISMNNGAHLMLQDPEDIGGFVVIVHGNKTIMAMTVLIHNLAQKIILQLKKIGVQIMIVRKVAQAGIAHKQNSGVPHTLMELLVIGTCAAMTHGIKTTKV